MTNAQFPDAIRDMPPVTQLYVSIDAGNKEALKEIDRPLFTDFWERFLACLEALKSKGQRTVYRLTLVKAHNMEQVRITCSRLHLALQMRAARIYFLNL